MTAPSWRSSSTSAAVRSRARRCPFPRGGRLDNREALEEVVEQREHRVRHLFGVAVRRFDPRKQACATHHSVAKESKAAGYASRNRLGKLSNPPRRGREALVHGVEAGGGRHGAFRAPRGFPRSSPRFLAFASRRGLARSRTARAAWPRVRPARQGPARPPRPRPKPSPRPARSPRSAWAFPPSRPCRRSPRAATRPSDVGPGGPPAAIRHPISDHLLEGL